MFCQLQQNVVSQNTSSVALSSQKTLLSESSSQSSKSPSLSSKHQHQPSASSILESLFRSFAPGMSTFRVLYNLEVRKQIYFFLLVFLSTEIEAVLSFLDRSAPDKVIVQNTNVMSQSASMYVTNPAQKKEVKSFPLETLL